MKTKYVHKYFTEALFELMRIKDYSLISINEIVNKSGCSRASFYRNFLNKEAIIDSYIQNELSPIFLRNYNEHNLETELIAEFRELLEYKEQLKLLLAAGLLTKLDEIIFEKSSISIKLLNPESSKYDPYYYAGATSSFIKAWISFNFEETPEELASMFLKSFYPIATIKKVR